jgi:hypothetical protein
MSNDQRRAYAQSAGSLNASYCLTCQRKEGAGLARYASETKRKIEGR